MKKLLLVLFALTFVASVCSAEGGQCGSDPLKATAKGVESAGEFVGKVVSVTLAEPTKGVTDSTVKISDEMGNPISFTVNSAAKITDASLNVITLNQLKAGEKVKVKAVETKEAKAINVVK